MSKKQIPPYVSDKDLKQKEHDYHSQPDNPQDYFKNDVVEMEDCGECEEE